MAPLAHGHDFDDTHAPSITHASAVVLPAVLALAEEEGLDGGRRSPPRWRDTRSAGWAWRRPARRPGRFHARGWHATPACGAFAAALAAGRCLGLGRVALTSALGIAASCASGLLEFLEDGSIGEATAPGLGGALRRARGRVRRGRIHRARQRARGPLRILSRRSRCTAPDLTPALADLGHALGNARGRPQALPLLPLQPRLSGRGPPSPRRPCARPPTPSRRSSAVVPAGEVPIVCEPAAVKRAPRTDYDAKFSLPFTVAAALLEGRVGVSTFDADDRRPAAAPRPRSARPRRARALYRGPGLALPEDASRAECGCASSTAGGGGARARATGAGPDSPAHRVRDGGEVPRQRGTDPARIPGPRAREGRARTSRASTTWARS